MRVWDFADVFMSALTGFHPFRLLHAKDNTDLHSRIFWIEYYSTEVRYINDMSESKTFKVGKRFQITVPRAVCDQLNIQHGDRLLVNVQGGTLILLPQPQSYTSQLESLHQEIWEGLDTNNYLGVERLDWDT
jgi:AbrB family looped-hinge helix DNA binding protein